MNPSKHIVYAANAILNQPKLIDQLSVASSKRQAQADSSLKQAKNGKIGSNKASPKNSQTALFSNNGKMSVEVLTKMDEPLALKQIRARQDDYWNKIAMYNYRIHLME